MRANTGAKAVGDRERQRAHRSGGVAAGEHARSRRFLRHRIGAVEAAHRVGLDRAAERCGEGADDVHTCRDEEAGQFEGAPPFEADDRAAVSALYRDDPGVLDADATRLEIGELFRRRRGLSAKEDRGIAVRRPLGDESAWMNECSDVASTPSVPRLSS